LDWPVVLDPKLLLLLCNVMMCWSVVFFGSANLIAGLRRRLIGIERIEVAINDTFPLLRMICFGRSSTWPGVNICWCCWIWGGWGQGQVSRAHQTATECGEWSFFCDRGNRFHADCSEPSWNESLCLL
jgi:hypothetical protein